jgi:energy-coupling factor transporter ATP-binding protein EcfA2
MSKPNTILVVGRFGSGKSTFLNTLAGVYWTYRDGQFVVNECAKEAFPTSNGKNGCTMEAVSKSITTFDGRQLTVIDTVGFEDTLNAETFYNSSSLTEVMNQHECISAVVIVMNYREKRITQAFVESLCCIPKSFNTKIQQNVVLVYTNCSEEDVEEGTDKYGDKLFAQDVELFRQTMKLEADNDHINFPIFCTDNRSYKKCSDNARHTIDNLQRFLDHVAKMPKLSSKGFKEMKGLSQFQTAIQKKIENYFQPSNARDRVRKERLSPFEDFLFRCSGVHLEKLPKVASIAEFSAADYAVRFCEALQKDLNDKLPGEMKRMCDEVDHELQLGLSTSHFHGGGTALSKVTNSILATGGASFAMIGMMTLGLPLIPVLFYPFAKIFAHTLSDTWSRAEVIDKIVFEISDKQGKSICNEYSTFVTHQVRKMQDEIKALFPKN